MEVGINPTMYLSLGHKKGAKLTPEEKEILNRKRSIRASFLHASFKIRSLWPCRWPVLEGKEPEF